MKSRNGTPALVMCLLFVVLAFAVSGCSLFGGDGEGDDSTTAADAGAATVPGDQANAPGELVPTAPPPPPPPDPTAVPALPPGVDPSQLPPGIDPSQLPPGIDPSQLPPGVDPSQLPPGVDPSQLPPGVDPSQLPPGFDPSKLPPGFDPSKLPPGFDPSQIPEGMDPSKLPEGAVLPAGVPSDALAKLQDARHKRQQLNAKIRRLNYIIDNNKTRDPADVVRLNRMIIARRELDSRIAQAERQMREAGFPVPGDEPGEPVEPEPGEPQEPPPTGD